MAHSGNWSSGSGSGSGSGNGSSSSANQNRNVTAALTAQDEHLIVSILNSS